MKGIDSTGAQVVHVPGRVGGWMEVKAVLRIAYSNKKGSFVNLNLHFSRGQPIRQNDSEY
jgi:hypothetical protein